MIRLIMMRYLISPILQIEILASLFNNLDVGENDSMGNESGQYRVKSKIGVFALVIITLVCVGMFLFRLVRGVDITDESFYVSIGYSIVKGNRYLADTWEQCATSSFLTAFFLKIYELWLGGFEGAILYLRIAFFVVNAGAAFFIYKVQSIFLKKHYAFLIALFYLFYAPFHLYTFSYNNLADMFLVLMISALLIATEKQESKFYILGGFFAAMSALAYPTLVLLCLFVTIFLLLLCKKVGKGGLYYASGGLITALIVTGVLVATIGLEGIQTGIAGIFTDPAYNMSSITISSKLFDAIIIFFAPFYEGGWILNSFFLIFVICILLKNKYPKCRLIVVVYPLIVLFSIYPLGTKGTFEAGIYTSRLAFLMPFLILFTEKNRGIFLKYILIGWLPSVICYLIIALSSWGGGSQAVQCLIAPAMFTLAEIVLIVEESMTWKKGYIFRSIIASIVIMAGILGEMRVHYGVVYREGPVSELNKKINAGPYKGIYTTAEKKEYLEKMSKRMTELSDAEKSCMVLYHSNFVYLMLDMKPATPTTWGIYPNIDNQISYMKYFSTRPENIPDDIYIVNVPEYFNNDWQNEEAYSFCTTLQNFIKQNYELDCTVTENKIGSVRKYRLMRDREKLCRKIRKRQQKR